MFAKKILYLSDSGLSAWQWRGGKLAREGEFHSEADGLENFAGYLAKSPNTPIHLLVDVIEEDFRNETIPHILGKDRQALIQRKLNQLFRNTTYRHADIQGRESEGRRDDRLLLTGLTNEELLNPWMERIARSKLPLAGIYSLPLLSQLLIKKLELPLPHQLLITRQATGLRQSYFQEGQLKFSRLTLLSSEDMEAIQVAVTREAARTQQYLNSLRLLPRDQALDVNLCGARLLLQLQPEAMSAPLLRYHLIDLETTADRLGVKVPANRQITSELLYLHLLGKFSPPQHYAVPEQLRHNRLRQVRTAILGATAATIAAVAYVAAVNFEEAFDAYNQGEKLSRETQGLQAQYLAIKNTFPPTPATPEDMKSAVELVEAAYRQDVMPEALMALLSRALESSPSITVNQIKWRVSDTPSEETPSAPPSSLAARVPGGSGSTTPAMTLGLGKPYQVIVLDGEITPFTDYRSALDSIDSFLAALKKNPALRVTPLAMPVNIGSQSSLKGSAGKKEPEKAGFTVKLILAPTP